MADQKQAIMKALKQAMGGAPMSSPRPKMRPAGLARGMDATPAEIAALERGNRMQMLEGRENEAILKGEKAISDADKAKLLKMMMGRMKKSPAGMMKGGKVMKYEDGGRVDKILRDLGKGSDMSVAALLRMIEGAGGGMGSGAAMVGRKAAGMNPRGAGTTRSGRQLNKMGVSEDIVGMLEGRRPGRKAPLQAMGFESGGAVRKKKVKKPKMGCVMKGRGGKYKGQS